VTKILFGLRYLRLALMNLPAALAKLQERPVHPETDETVVLSQQRHAILMNVLRKRSDLRNIFRMRRAQARACFL